MTPPDRNRLRRSFRDARRDLPEVDRTELDRCARDRLLEVLRNRPVGTVALSLPTDGEVDVAALAPTLRSDGWTVVLPVVDEDGPGSMTFHRWDAGASLRTNRYGIGEPVGGGVVEVAELDVVVVPAVAVDLAGTRLGFGGGFYDRALVDRGPRTLLVAVVHDEQVADSLPVEDHDVAVDVVVTPTLTHQVTGPT